MTSMEDALSYCDHFFYIHELFYEDDKNLPIYAFFNSPCQPCDVSDTILHLSEEDGRICRVKTCMCYSHITLCD